MLRAIAGGDLTTSQVRPSTTSSTRPPTTGTPTRVRAIDQYVAEVRERASLDVRRFHGLRRAFTTLLDRGGVSRRVTMEMAGHREAAMTIYYQLPMESQHRAAASVVDQQLRALCG